MTLVAQITEYSCALACMESFLRDHHREITQWDLIQTCGEVCTGKYAHAGGIDPDFENGTFRGLSNLEKIGEKHGFSITIVEVKDLPSTVSPGMGFLILILGKHCLRYLGKSPEYPDQFLLMNPKFALQFNRKEKDPDTGEEKVVPEEPEITSKWWAEIERWTPNKIHDQPCVFAKVTLEDWMKQGGTKCA
ncbi:MAG: hypothetical protein V1792_05995 [Pseudomonadota bacterium]